MLAITLVLMLCTPAFAFNFNTDNAIFFGNQGFSTEWLFRDGYSAADDAAVNNALAASGTSGVTFLSNGRIIPYGEIAANPNAQGVPATAAALAGKTVRDKDGNDVPAVPSPAPVVVTAVAATNGQLALTFSGDVPTGLTIADFAVTAKLDGTGFGLENLAYANRKITFTQVPEKSAAQVLEITLAKAINSSKLGDFAPLSGTVQIPASDIAVKNFVDSTQLLTIMPGQYVAKVILKSGYTTDGLTATLNGEPMLAHNTKTFFYKEVNTKTGLKAIVTGQSNTEAGAVNIPGGLLSGYVASSEMLTIMPGQYVAKIVLATGKTTDDMSATIDGQPMLAHTSKTFFYKEMNKNTATANIYTTTTKADVVDVI